MRAVAVGAFGEPPELLDLPPPEPGPDELLVHLGAAGVNPYDRKIAEGALRGRLPHRFPLVLGVDGAGRIVRTGAQVTHFRVGEEVVGQFLHPPVGIGTYAEFATVPESVGIARRPPGLSVEVAAALPTAGMTAWFALETLGLNSGERLLIVGATGGVGGLAVQLARTRGISVVAVGRPGSEGYLQNLGANEVVAQAGPEPSVDPIRRLRPEGFDGLLDLVSDPARFALYASLLRPEGIAVSPIGSARSETESRAPGARREVNLQLIPRPALMERLVAEVVSGRLRVPLEERYPLEEVPARWRSGRWNAHRGKTVILLGPARRSLDPPRASAAVEGLRPPPTEA